MSETTIGEESDAGLSGQSTPKSPKSPSKKKKVIKARRSALFEATSKSDLKLDKKKVKKFSIDISNDMSSKISPTGTIPESPATPQTPVGGTSPSSSLSRKSEATFLELLGNRRDEFFDESTFETLEAAFLETLKEVESSPGCGSFYPEVEKIFTALRKYFDEGRALVDKYNELSEENRENKERIADAIRIQEDDQTMIASLKKELDRAWKQMDDYQEKEQQQKELIHTLETELFGVQKMFEQVPLLAGGPEAVLELQRTRDDLLKEKDQLSGDLFKLRDVVGTLTSNIQTIEKEKEQMDETIKDLTQENYKRRNDLQRESRRREKAEQELKQSRTELEGKTDQVVNLQQQLAKQKDNIGLLEHKLKEIKIQKDQLTKELEVLNLRVLRLQQDLESQIQNADLLGKENSQLYSEIKAKEDELSQLRSQNVKLTKLREMLTRKINSLEEQRNDLDQQREELRGLVGTMQREIDTAKRHSEQDKKNIDDLVRDKDTLTKNLLKANTTLQKQGGSMKYQEQSKRATEMELLACRNEVDKLKSTIQMMERERDRQMTQGGELTKKIYTLTSEMKVKDIQMYDAKKKLLDTESKLRQQVNLYEAVRSDRNLFNKNLIETQDEVTEMKRKLKIMTHQIEQLKDEVNAKDSALLREHLVSQKVEREKETIKTELSQTKEQMTIVKQNLDGAQTEQRRLTKLLQDAERDMMKKQKELAVVRNERDILGTQLVRRNDEVVLLYQKIQIHQLILRRGEHEYRKRIDDLRLLKLEIQKLRREKFILAKSARKVDELQREIYHMQRELMRERTRCKALEEEMENPVNIHRWRKLQGNDPSTYELIQKIHLLQRRLIARTELVVEKEVLIQEKEQLYTELKNILSRQPKPELAGEILIYQKTLRDKNRQMKGMASELNMYESQLAENKAEVERMARELQEYKKKYYVMKKQEQEKTHGNLSPRRISDDVALRRGKGIITGGFKNQLFSSPRHKFTLTQ